MALVHYFVKTAAITGGATPSDANDGRDPIGFALSGASYANSSKTITSTNAFTSYTWTAGDQIYLNAGSGITPGLYEIAGKTDASNITLVDSAGSDSSSDVGSSTGPWATIQKGADTAGFNDDVWICADGTHTPSATIDIDTTSWVRFRGANARGVPLSGPTDYATISGSSLAADADLINQAVTGTHLYHLRITAATNHGIAQGTFTPRLLVLVNCRVDNCTDAGIEGSGEKKLFGCSIDNNGTIGVGVAADTPYVSAISMFHCRVHNNGDSGIRGSNGGRIVHSTIFANGGDGLEIHREGTYDLVHCTFDSNTGDGVGVSGSSLNVNVNRIDCVFSNNSAYQLSMFSGGSDWATGSSFYHNNGGTGLLQNTTLQPTEVDDDPEFTSITPGSEDYLPDSDSPLRTAACLPVFTEPA